MLTQQFSIELELVLTAVGAGSIDEDALALQRHGYIDASIDPVTFDIIF